MYILLIIFLVLFQISLAEEENIISKNDKLPEKIQKALGIETITIKEKILTKTKKYPGIIKDDLTLSEKVYSPVDGIVKKLLVKEGDKVKKGQILAYIYSPQIAKITTDIKQVEVNYKTLKKLYEREKRLYENKLITYTRFYKAKIDYENAKAKLKALKDSLKIYGDVKNGLLLLKSDIDGYISKQNVVLGDSVNINKMLFKIHSHKKLWTIAYVPVSESIYIKKGLKAQVVSPLGKTYGFIDFISHSVDINTKRLEVRIITDNKKELLKPNMFVDVYIPIKKVKGLFIPVSGVVLKDDKYIGFLKIGKDRFKPVELKLGERVGDYYKVLEGLKVGDKVVVKGTIYLKAKFFGEAEE